MDREANKHQGGSTVVDLKTKKRRRVVVDPPQVEIPNISSVYKNYHEGTYDNIKELLKTEDPPEEYGVFLKGKIPPQYGPNLEKVLKNGGFSKSIRLYEDHLNPSKSYLCKVIEAAKFCQDEVKHMCQLDYVYICKLTGFVRKSNEYQIYMEYCGKNLSNIVRDRDFPFKFDLILHLTKQLCMAVEYAHNKKILHLDIKPENICLLFTADGLTLKLADWGSSKSVYSSTEVTSITILYASPELLYRHICHFMRQPNEPDEVTKFIPITQNFCKNYNSIDNISHLSDSYSIGLTVNFMWTGKHLYGKLNWISLCRMFAENPSAAKNLLLKTSDFINDLVGKLIEGDSYKRCTVKEIQKMIFDYTNPQIEIIQDTGQDTDFIPVPENQDLNVPFLDQLF